MERLRILITKAGFADDIAKNEEDELHILAYILEHPLSNLRGNTEVMERYERLSFTENNVLTALAIEVLKSQSDNRDDDQFLEDLYNIKRQLDYKTSVNSEEYVLQEYLNGSREEINPKLLQRAEERLKSLQNNGEIKKDDSLISVLKKPKKAQSVCPSKDLKMSKFMETTENCACFLKLFFGLEHMLFFHFVLTQTPEKNIFSPCVASDIAACKEEATKDYAEFFDKGPDKIAEKIFERRDDFLRHLTGMIRESGMHKDTELAERIGMPSAAVQYPDDDSVDLFASNYDANSLTMGMMMKMTADEAVRYVRKGWTPYIAIQDQKFGFAKQCDADPTQDKYYKRDYNISKSPSLINLGGKKLCPKWHRPIAEHEKKFSTLEARLQSVIDGGDDQTDKAKARAKELKAKLVAKKQKNEPGFWKSVNNECCRYDPDLVARSSLKFLASSKILNKKFDLEKFSQHVGGMIHKTTRNIDELQAMLGAAQRKLDDKEFMKKSTDDRYQQEAYVTQLKEELAKEIRCRDILDNQTESWKHYDKLYKEWQSRQTDDDDNFVKQMERVVTFKASISLTYHLSTSLEDKAKDLREGNIVMQFVRGIKDKAINFIIMVLHHPNFSLFLITALETLKKNWCRKYSIWNGNYQVDLAYRKTLEMTNAFEHAKNAILAILSDPDEAERFATMCVKSAMTMFRCMGLPGDILATVGEIATMTFMPVAVNSIQIYVWGKIYKTGFDKIVTLLDFSTCGQELVHITVDDLSHPQNIDWAKAYLANASASSVIEALDETKQFGMDEMTIDLTSSGSDMVQLGVEWEEIKDTQFEALWQHIEGNGVYLEMRKQQNSVAELLLRMVHFGADQLPTINRIRSELHNRDKIVGSFLSTHMPSNPETVLDFLNQVQSLLETIDTEQIRFDDPNDQKNLIMNITHSSASTTPLRLKQQWTRMKGLKLHDIVRSVCWPKNKTAMLGPKYYKALKYTGLVDRNIHLVLRAIESLEKYGMKFEEFLDGEVKQSVVDAVRKNAGYTSKWANREKIFVDIENRLLLKQ